MQQLLTYLRTKIKTWQDNRFLKRHGCESWAQYNRQYDPDINWRATRVNDFYHGYPYVYCFENHRHEVYHWDVHIDGTYVIDNWCDDNCKGKHRMDFHRVIKYHNQWEFNDLGGGDYIFAAFKNERDFNWFLMRWS